MSGSAADNVVDLADAKARAKDAPKEGNDRQSESSSPTDSVLVVFSEAELAAAKELELTIPLIVAPPGDDGTDLSAWVATHILPNTKRVYFLPIDQASQQQAMAIAQKAGTIRCRRVRLSHGINTLAELVETGMGKQIVDFRSAKHLDPVLAKVDEIDRREPFVTTLLKNDVLPMLAGLDEATVEDYFVYMRQRFALRHKALKALRDALYPPAPPGSKDDGKPKPYEMTPQEEVEALVLLRDPEILDVIEKDLTEACGIQGEGHLKVALFLVMTSRITDSPVSATIFGASSEGKSYVVSAVASAMPPESVVTLSSLSTRSIEYASQDLLDHKIVIIQEMDGIADDIVLSVIRQAQSEHRLSRLVAQYDKDGGPRVMLTESEIRAAWIVTTTTEQYHDENATRVWSFYVSSDPEQTKRVLEFTKTTETLTWKRGSAERERRRLRLQNAQRLLRPLDVVIPWAEKLQFPHSSARHRRDCSRFLSMVKLVALLRQNQKEVMRDGDMEYLEADIENDYAAAYRIMLPIVAGTLGELSERCKRVLRVAVQLTNNQLADQDGKGDVDFSIRDLQAKAEELGLDLSNGNDVRKQVRKLVQDDYLAVTEGVEQNGGGKAKRWRLASDGLSVDAETGELIGVVTAQLGISTPNELAAMVAEEST